MPQSVPLTQRLSSLWQQQRRAPTAAPPHHREPRAPTDARRGGERARAACGEAFSSRGAAHPLPARPISRYVPPPPRTEPSRGASGPRRHAPRESLNAPSMTIPRVCELYWQYVGGFGARRVRGGVGGVFWCSFFAQGGETGLDDRGERVRV